MLARNAESLYWIGRYVERADDTAHPRRHRAPAAGDSSVDPDQNLPGAVEGVGHGSARPTAGCLVVDRYRGVLAGHLGGCSIVEAISAAGENARGAGSHLDGDVGVSSAPPTARWVSANAPTAPVEATRVPGVHREPGRHVRRAGRFDVVARRRVPVLVLSRAIEQLDADGPDAAVPGGRQRVIASLGDGASVRRCADTYLRTYRGVLDAVRVVGIHVWTGSFPRSVFYSLKLAEHSLDELLHRQHNRVGSTEGLLGRARSELEFCRPGICSRVPGEPAGQPAEDLLRRRGGTGEAVLHSAPWVAWTDAGHRSLVIEEGRSDVAHARGARDGLCLQVAGDRVVQQAQLTPRSDSRQNVILNRVGRFAATRSLPVHRLLGHRGDVVRSTPRTGWRSPASSVVGGRSRSRRRSGVLGRPGDPGAIDRVLNCSRRPGVHPASKRIERVGRRIEVQRPAAGGDRGGPLGAGRVSYVPGTRVHSRAGRPAQGQQRLPGFRPPIADLLRGGIPARYVSRAICIPNATPGSGGVVDGQSHAWIRPGPANGGTMTRSNATPGQRQFTSVSGWAATTPTDPPRASIPGRVPDLDVVVEDPRLA